MRAGGLAGARAAWCAREALRVEWGLTGDWRACKAALEKRVAKILDRVKEGDIRPDDYAHACLGRDIAAAWGLLGPLLNQRADFRSVFDAGWAVLMIEKCVGDRPGVESVAGPAFTGENVFDRHEEEDER